MSSPGVTRYRLTLAYYPPPPLGEVPSGGYTEHLVFDGPRAARGRGFRRRSSGRDVLSDDRAGSDERLFADLDAGTEDRTAADPSARRIVGPFMSSWRCSVLPM